MRVAVCIKMKRNEIQANQAAPDAAKSEQSQGFTVQSEADAILLRSPRGKLQLRAPAPLFKRRGVTNGAIPSDGDRKKVADSAPSLVELRHNAILAQLARAWQRAPHLPLGQVVEAIAVHARTDVWGMSDDEFFLTARTWTGAIVPPGEDQ